MNLLYQSTRDANEVVTASQAILKGLASGGGLFVPSRLSVKLGEEVFVVATLPDNPQKVPLKGKVVWVSQHQNGISVPGFGIQLSGEKGVYYKSEAEKILAGLKSEGRTSYTM